MSHENGVGSQAQEAAVKRYRHTGCFDHECPCFTEMRAVDSGEWVKWAEHDAEVRRLREALEAIANMPAGEGGDSYAMRERAETALKEQAR